MSTIAGTPFFLAPEVVLGSQSRTYTNKIDVWSLGIIAYQLLIGTTPFHDSTSFTELYRRIVEADFEIPTDAPISNLGRDFIRTLLQPDPEIRPTAQQALRHPWIAEYCPRSYLQLLHEFNLEADPELYSLQMWDGKPLPIVPPQEVQVGAERTLMLDIERGNVENESFDETTFETEPELSPIGSPRRPSWVLPLTRQTHDDGTDGDLLPVSDELCSPSLETVLHVAPQRTASLLADPMSTFILDTAPIFPPFNLPNLLLHRQPSPALVWMSGGGDCADVGKDDSEIDRKDSGIARMDSGTTFGSIGNSSVIESAAPTVVPEVVRPRFLSEDLSRPPFEPEGWRPVTQSQSAPIFKFQQPTPAMNHMSSFSSTNQTSESYAPWLDDPRLPQVEDLSGPQTVWDMLESRAGPKMRTSSNISLASNHSPASPVMTWRKSGDSDSLGPTPGSPFSAPLSPPTASSPLFCPVQSPTRTPDPNFASLSRRVRRGSLPHVNAPYTHRAEPMFGQDFARGPSDVRLFRTASTAFEEHVAVAGESNTDEDAPTLQLRMKRMIGLMAQGGVAHV